MTLKDFESYKSNPTKIEGIVIKEYQLKPNETTMVNTDTGEVGIFRPAAKTKTLPHDTLEYVKVYTNALPQIKDLNTPALKVWTYILSNLTPKRDEVSIFMKDCIEYTGYTNPPPIYKGLVELLEKQFIFRKVGSDSIYFINSNIFFNGKRIKTEE